MHQKLNISFNSVIDNWSNKNLLHVLAIILTAKVLLSYSFANIFFPGYSSGYSAESLVEEIIVTIVAAPIIETMVFQSLIIQTILQKFHTAYLPAAMTSALFFSVAHHYSIPYMLYAFIAGILYTFLYLVAQKKNYTPFWIVYFSHAMFNLIVFLFSNV